jgi:hypothetical protein
MMNLWVLNFQLHLTKHLLNEGVVGLNITNDGGLSSSLSTLNYTKDINKEKKRIITNRGVAYPGRQIRLSDPVGSYWKNYRVLSDPIGIRGKLLESLISDSEKILLEFLGSYRILFGSFALDMLVFILNKENFSNILVESNNIN